MDQLDGNRSLPFDRDQLGRFVREAWVRWAETRPNPKPSWLVPYDDLSEPDKEADRQIGETVARWTLVGDAARAALKAALSDHDELLYMLNAISGSAKIRLCVEPDGRPDFRDILLSERHRFLLCRLLRNAEHRHPPECKGKIDNER